MSGFKQTKNGVGLWEGTWIANKLVGASSPTQDNEAASKLYVDSQISGENHWDMNGSSTAIYPYVNGVQVQASSAYFQTNLGIGTSSPSSELEIMGDSADFFIRQADGNYSVALRTTVSGDGILNLWSDSSVNNQASALVQLSAVSSQANWINNGGNVGIGTSSPSAGKLVVQAGSTGQEILVGQDSGGDITSVIGHLIDDSGYLQLNNGSASPHAVIRGDGGNSYINALGGNLGIGTTSPSTALHVSGGAVTISNTSAPSTPSAAGALFVSGGALWFIGSSGTQTQIAVP